MLFTWFARLYYYFLMLRECHSHNIVEVCHSMIPRWNNKSHLVMSIVYECLSFLMELYNYIVIRISTENGMYVPDSGHYHVYLFFPIEFLINWKQSLVNIQGLRELHVEHSQLGQLLVHLGLKLRVIDLVDFHAGLQGTDLTLICYLMAVWTYPRYLWHWDM